MPNRLVSSASPYLLLHAHEDVDWFEWSEEAWQAARERDVPVLVSVGYHACHWCHVMREESFDDPEIARLLNDGFVAIKVDREERPEVDAVFMTATQALTGRGGWPNTVFCTPDGEPFFAGTYFPREARAGMPGFGELLEALSGAWQTRRDEVIASAGAIAAELRSFADAPAPVALDLHDVRQRLAGSFDAIHGGFGGAPKFPPHLVIEGLLVSGDPGELDMASHTLEAMARGGIHDQVGGGFHRYSVDAAWMVPHFEKMLYDNALLLGAYTGGWRRTPDHEPWRRSLFADVVRRLVAWAERELRTETGAFAASLDADSADIRGMAHEGIYYAWSPELLLDALGDDDADWAGGVFHVTKTGTFEHGLSTLLLHGHPDAERLARVRDRLAEVRAERFAPARDDKVVAAWNGLMIDALVRAAMVFGEPHWLELARDAAEATWAMVDADGVLARTVVEGRRGPDGGCEDYAALALGYARLAGATGERTWLDRAAQLVDTAHARFATEDGGWWGAEPDPTLFARSRDLADAATPSATSLMVAACRLVGLLAERQELLEVAARGLATLHPTLVSTPQVAGWALREAMVSDEARRGLGQAHVTVETDDVFSDLARAVWRMAPEGSAIWRAPAGEAGERVITCRGTTCFEPVSAVEGLKDVLWRRS